jgi:hypothetical protein
MLIFGKYIFLNLFYPPKQIVGSSYHPYPLNPLIHLALNRLENLDLEKIEGL